MGIGELIKWLAIQEMSITLLLQLLFHLAKGKKALSP